MKFNPLYLLGGLFALAVIAIAVTMMRPLKPAPSPTATLRPAAAAPSAAATAKPAPAARPVDERFVIKRILPISGPIKYGEWHWDESGAPAGPLVITVDLDARVLSIFRSGYEIGATAVLLDVSGEGLRVEVAEDQGAHLAPMFHLRVPMFKVGVTVRRIWVAPGSQGAGRVQCGASLIESDERAMRTWKALIENVGTGSGGPGVLRPQPAKVEKERVLGRLGQFLADAPLVGGLSLPWRQGGRPS